MKLTASIELKRRGVVDQMLRLGAMRRGTLNEQYLSVARKGAAPPASHGPYYVLSRKESGKTVSRRIRAQEVERVRGEIACHRRFMELCREFVELSEQLGEAERSVPEPKEMLKKTPNSPSRRPGK